MQEVSKEEFDFFIENYPGTIKVDVCGISEPPLVGYYCFEKGEGWNSLVASYHGYRDKTKRVYRIAE